MRMTLLAAVVLGLLAFEAQAQNKPKPPEAPAAPPIQFQSEDEKALYSLGYNFGKSLAVFSLSPAELEVIKRAMADGVSGAAPAVDVNQYGNKVQGIVRSRQGKVNEAYLAKAAAEKGAITLPSGVVYRELQAGTGASPKPTDTVSVHYRGTLITGEEFDSSHKRNQPAEFPLNGVIPCWTQGVQKMKVGAKAKLVCPPKTAYGDRPPGSKIPPNAVLEFEVELLDIPGSTFKK
ncbi:MAG TPA: FKBP-type peptidyl-prolyl cis-trans isomerase [Myxococcaceae bacterium]|nr:FKBP-type peptidyl-prolyl cis-trans isomerase [Myxococcaceae bacterium]